MQMLAPFLITGFALYEENKYPAKLFVGDVWCYFSGMLLSLASVEGRYGKTIVLLILP